jgi:uncharacterized protein
MDTKRFKKDAIYMTRHGSHAYGLNTPTSDLDIKGVFVADHAHYLGFLNKIEQVEEREPNDLVIYELTKFFRLAADCNPNIIEVLWTDDSDILSINQLGEDLRALAPQFLSQKAKHTFTGYASAQLKRIKNHYRWIQNAPKDPGKRYDWGLPEEKQWCSAIDFNPATVANYSHEEQNRYGRELEWRDARKNWEHYQTWRQNRNPARSALEEKHGYDTKHGMHLVRLMRMGEEILKTGKVIVKRPDREELLAIRNEGIWSYEQLVDWAEKKDEELQTFHNSGASPLPREPDRKLLDQACQAMVEKGLYGLTLLT